MFLALPLIAMLAGCTHYYSKPGMTAAGFSADKRDCENIAVEAAKHDNARFCVEVERCLIAKGWERD
jgi:hypothetical protein